LAAVGSGSHHIQ